MWKEAFVIPVFKKFKKGDKTNINNYRPISKLSCIPKLFEQVICDSLTFYCKNIICNQQHGFMAKRSTVTNLILFLHECSSALEKGNDLDCIYTEFSTAFDQLSHKIIIYKLTMFGFPPWLITWITSYLQNRSYKVKFRNSFSKTFFAKSGVPQGSHLGPLLFILAINDVPLCLKSSEILIFADDMKIFKTINSPNDRLLLQDDINNFSKWCTKNDLSLNLIKCQTMSFSMKRFPNFYNYHISQHTLLRVSCFKDLGVLFTSTLDSNSMLDFIKRWSKEFNDPYTTLALYNCLVRPHLEYASQVSTTFYSIHIERLESVQHRIIRFALKGLPWSDPYNLPPYEHRINLG